jgi:hypothetical protein
MDKVNCFKRRKRSYSDDILLEYSDSDSEGTLFNIEDNNIEDNNIEDNNIEDNNIEDNNIEDNNIEDNNIEKIYKDDNNLINTLNDFKFLKIDSNKGLFMRIIKKIDDLEKKVEILSMVNIKIDTLKKDIDKILVEKDYVIENMKYVINELEEKLKEQSKETNFDYVSNESISSYYS